MLFRSPPATPTAKKEPAPEESNYKDSFARRLETAKSTQLVAQLEARGIEPPRGLQTTNKFRALAIDLILKDRDKKAKSLAPTPKE